MSRVRNADEFLLCFRRISADYERDFGPRLSQIRRQYAGGPEEWRINDHLEIHARTYFVNAFLAALNWRLDKQACDSLPSLVPEVPIRSEERRSIRFLDYLGLERETIRSLLIVETKRPSAVLPRASAPAATYSEIVSRGLAGEHLLGEWNNWLKTLKDYVRSAQKRTQECPRRVVITNGDWLILFLNPCDAFLETGSCNPSDILVFENRSDIERRFNEVFCNLEHQQVLGEHQALTLGELPSLAEGAKVDRVLHGLRLLYIKEPRIHQQITPFNPVIKVAPVVFLRTRYGAWLRVESPPKEYILPRKYEDLPKHLNEVEQTALRLFSEINDRLGHSLQARALAIHYEDEVGFSALPGVQEINADEFLVLTGDKTHYLLPEPSVPECPYHDWHACQRDGAPSNPGPLLNQSVEPRSFFVSGKPHHCAHRDATNAKANVITTANRSRCGTRSGQEGQAFCEIWRFEQHLCCRTCAFEEVCTRTTVFRLPCQRPTSPGSPEAVEATEIDHASN